MPVPKSGRRSSSNLSHGAHPNREFPGKHAENGDPSRSLQMRARVQAPVSILEVLRSARHSLLPQILFSNSRAETAEYAKSYTEGTP